MILATTYRMTRIDMKKLFALIFCLVTSSLANAGLISTRSTAPATCTVGDVWINPGAATNDRIYTCTATNTWTKNSGRPWVIQSTAPSDLSLIWFDDDQIPGYLVLKLHNGTTWVEQAMGEGGSYTLPTASADTLGGIKVGARLSITDGVLSADVQSTDISGKEDSLGNPSTTGYVLSSTTAGVRSWVANGSGSQTWPSTAGIAVYGGSSAWGSSLTLDTDLASVSASDDSVPSAKATKAAIDALPEIIFGSMFTVAEDTPSAGKDTITITANTYQAYDANMITWPSAISATEVGYLDGLTEALSTSLSGKQTAYIDKIAVFNFVGGGSDIPDGTVIDSYQPAAGTITGAVITSTESCSIVIDLWRDTYTNSPPTVADTITASAKPTLSSSVKSKDVTLTGWTKTISADDIIRASVDSNTCTGTVTLTIYGAR